ncbi:hypothetical protein GGR52DRAFT_96688 [Hypoxylon sp. FL1284]|nr:hypothetical protein GGR52DRAFT_96688 [Hypoxylon sp. FL1284]
MELLSQFRVPKQYSAVESLPAEVLLNISKRLPPDWDHVKNFRLTCKTFAAVGMELICAMLSLQLVDRDLKKLVQISSSPGLARGVKLLRYAPATLFSPAISQQEYNRLTVQYHQERYPLSPGGYAQYPALVREQRRIMEEQRDIKAFLFALPRLPCLDRIFLYLGNAYTVDHYLADEKNYDHSVIDKLAGNHHVERVLWAMSRTQVSLSELLIDHVHFSFFDREDAQLHAMFQFLSELPIFGLIITGDTQIFQDTSKCMDVMRTGALRKCLSSFTNMKSFGLRFDHSLWGDGDNCAFFDEARMVPMTQLLPSGFVWSRLKDLKLSEMICERQDLMEVLSEYKRTLRSLSLRNIQLKSTSPMLLFMHMRQELYLESLWLYGEISGCYEFSQEEDEQEPPLMEFDNVEEDNTEVDNSDGDNPESDEVEEIVIHPHEESSDRLFWEFQIHPTLPSKLEVSLRSYVERGGKDTPNMKCPINMRNALWDYD